MQRTKTKKDYLRKFKNGALCLISFCALIACQPKVSKRLESSEPLTPRDEKCLARISKPLVLTQHFLASIDLKIRKQGKAFRIRGHSAFREGKDFYGEFDGFGIPAMAASIIDKRFVLFFPDRQKAYQGNADEGIEKILYSRLSVFELQHLMLAHPPFEIDLKVSQYQKRKNTLLLESQTQLKNAFKASIDLTTCRMTSADNLLNQSEKIVFEASAQEMEQGSFSIENSRHYVSWKVSDVKLKPRLETSVFEIQLSHSVSVESIDDL